MAKRATRILHVNGMHCTNCESRIEKMLGALPGVERAQASYRRGSVKVWFTGEPDIAGTLKKGGYPPAEGAQKKGGPARGLLIAAALLIFFAAGSRFGLFAFFNAFPQAREGMGLGMLLVVGLLTSVHCVAMCGGINLSQAMGGGAARLRSPALYNLGRVISYTAVGFAVGALGSVVQLSRGAQAAVQLIAGACMVVMGLNLMNAFPALRRLMPSMPKFVARRVAAGREKSNSALMVGLLNGLMPCGPLQAMQLYALSTGSALKGALSMLMFSLGTVPMMFALGALGSLLSRRSAGRMMAVGAALVAVMGVAMLGNGMGLAGLSLPALMPKGEVAVAADGEISSDVQELYTELSPYGYPAISVAAGVPVRWNLHAAPGTLNGCNNRLYLGEYGIEKALVEGDNLIEFTPERSGEFLYSCWMGMIRSTITVADGPAQPAAAATAPPGAQYAPGCCA